MPSLTTELSHLALALNLPGFLDYLADFENWLDAVLIYSLYLFIYTHFCIVIQALVAAYQEVMGQYDHHSPTLADYRFAFSVEPSLDWEALAA